MSQCVVIDQPKNVYNAVNIKINNPKASISDKIKNDSCGNKEFNAVNLEINEPELQPAKKPIYTYPTAEDIITYDRANIAPIDIPDLPMIPVAYKTSYTYISTDLTPEPAKKVENVVPEPYLTTIENEKLSDNNLTFNGLSFKAAPKPEILKDADMKPAVDTKKVNENLTSKDFDVQALQLKEIVDAALHDKENATPYISTEIFSNIIDIIDRDTTSLSGPTEEQIKIRESLIIYAKKAEEEIANGADPKDIKLPQDITEEDIAKALMLSPLEMAERNKEYAISALAALDKVYIDEFEKQTGNVIPLTDLPGISSVVETLKSSKNSDLRITSLVALGYIARPEYEKEISAIFKIASQDKDINVAYMASVILNGGEPIS